MIASVEKGYEHRNAVLKAACAASCVGREYHRPSTIDNSANKLLKPNVCFIELP